MNQLKSLARRGLTGAALPVQTLIGRIVQYGPRPPRFTGAYGSFEDCLAAVPRDRPAGCDHEAANSLYFDRMSQIHLWDYPLLFWLERLLKPGMTVLDTGGNLATKYRAFGRLLDLTRITWVIHDLPAVIRRGRALQAEGRLPAAVRFIENPGDCPAPDVLVASGLLQYLDRPFGELLGQLERRPPIVLLNKVAMREGPEVVTLERAGQIRIPYRIRDRMQFMRELEALGLHVLDQWVIPDLSHRISTHPALGASTSRGFALTSDPPKAV